MKLLLQVRNSTSCPSKQGFPVVASELGLKRYAVQQLIGWLYKRRAAAFEEMTDLSKAAREQLAAHYAISAIEVIPCSVIAARMAALISGSGTSSTPL